MTDRQLRYLLLVAEEGNITSAAQKLFISQPSLSYLLNHVEKEVGAELFNRGTTPLTLTEAGESYIEAARKILSIKREMDNHISDIMGTGKSTLQIGCGAQLSAILYPQILPDFIRDNPDVNLGLNEDHFSNLTTRLLRGELDLVVANRPITDSAVESALLYREEVGLVAPADFSPKSYVRSDHSNPIIDPAELVGLPFIIVKKGQNLRRNIDDLFEAYNITPNIILETNNWETCFRMVAQNIGFTIIPQTTFFKPLLQYEVKRFSLPGNHYREICIFWLKRSYKLKALSKFVDTCKEKFSD